MTVDAATAAAARRGILDHKPEEGAPGFLVVELDRFQGPLDLLLHLIRQQDIDVFDIPISKITEQFLKTIVGVRAADLDHAGEFLEMAATLVRIKAQMLLPRREEDEDEDPRAELVRRLLEYEQIREIANRLSSAEAERSRLFGKGYIETRPRPPLEDTPLETTWEEVFEAALGVTVPEPRDRSHRVTTRTVAMEDKAILILDLLKGASRVEFRSLLEPFRDRMHGVMTFLAGLELTKRRLVALRQVSPFSDLWIYRRENPDEEAAAALPEVEEASAEWAERASHPGAAYDWDLEEEGDDEAERATPEGGIEGEGPEGEAESEDDAAVAETGADEERQ